jgi:cohesin complex subunit SA-1/2
MIHVFYRVNEDSSEDEAVSSDDDEPKKTTARKSSAKKKNKAKNDGEDTEMKNVDSDLGEEMDEQDEEEDDRPRSAKKQKKSNGNKKSAAARKSTAKKGGADARRSTAKKAVATGAAVVAAAGGGGAGKITKARIVSALNMLAKKILDQRVETPDKSVFAALLASTKPIPQIPSTTNPKQDTSSFRSRSISPVVTKIVSLTKSLSIPQLDGVARHLVQNFESNGMHIQLMNLLFRSVGGSLETDIKEGTDLEELEDKQWDDIMDKVVTAMQEETDADQVLLCADHPPAPPHETSQKIGFIAYRAIFKEFWYRLGHVLLAHAPSSSTRANDLMDDQEESDSDDDSIDSFDFDGDKKDEKTKDKTKKIIKTKATRKGASAAPVQEAFTSNSFQLEMMRDLISRITEFVTIGQPDLRSSGTLAIFQLGKACVERSVELESKIQIATRQFKAAKQSQSHAKMEAIRNKMDAWKRHKAELEEIVTGQVIQAAFIHRYRDANTTIRQECMDALSELSLIRPDIFLVDTYLKYFGWMTHDKKAVVRKAALSALLAPFEAHLEHVKTASSSRSSTMSSSPCRIDIAAMQHVTLKFLGRFVDCADDSEDVGVQELALKLLVAMINADFLDEVEDDNIWDSVNMKCLDVDSTPEVRKDALYFVLEQLDSFDDLEAQPLGEKKLLERFASLAGWLANLLADGHIPVDKIRIERIDYIVESLLQMPEHKDIVLNWRVMVQAIRNTNPNQQGSTEKEELTKQRVMLRMLVTSAKIFQKQIESSDKDARAGTKRRRSDQNEKDRTELSVALLQNLPSLFKNYQGDRIALRDVSGLAQLVQSSVLGLPSRKPDFQNVLKSLCQLYLDSSDEVTLQNVAATLSRWVEGDHTRVSEVKMQLKRLSRSLQDRLMDRFRESDPESTTGGRKSPRAAKKKQRTDHSQSSSLEIFSTSPEVDLEHSIALLLFRWKVLLEGCNTKYLFDEPEENEEHEMEGLFNTIAEAMGKRLKDREPTPEEKSAHDDRTIATISSIWKDGDPNVHEEVAKSVDLALRVLLLIIASELADTLERRAESENLGENDMDFDSQEFPVFKHRDAFVKLLIICFEQFLEKDAACSDDQYTFAGKIQASAGKVLSDLRSLFSPDFSEASDPLLRALALQGGQDVAMLLGGFARWFQSRDSATETADDEIKWMEETVLPLCRAICNNMKDVSAPFPLARHRISPSLPAHL